MKSLIFILFLAILFSCAPQIRWHEKDVKKWSPYLGKEITLTGKAIDQKVGARLLMLEDSSSIWIDDIRYWPLGYYSKKGNGTIVKVTGTVVEKFDLPVIRESKVRRMPLVPAGIIVPSGVNFRDAKHRFLLSNVTWEVISQN